MYDDPYISCSANIVEGMSQEIEEHDPAYDSLCSFAVFFFFNYFSSFNLSPVGLTAEYSAVESACRQTGVGMPPVGCYSIYRRTCV